MNPVMDHVADGGSALLVDFPNPARRRIKCTNRAGTVLASSAIHRHKRIA